ncbi:MAG: hemagglutinin repeat-containing protein, partial [Pseudomonas sp.]|nr:hemagglutinin repeat-containing protein [Pseudomonas sp.]
MQRKEDDSTHTNLGKTSSMEATSGDLILLAKEDIFNKGSNLKAKDNLLLQTESGDINLDAIRLENSHNSYFSGGFDKAKDVTYEVSTLRADNILMQSGNEINLEASKLSADGMINLNASNDINIEAVNSQYYRDFQTTKKGTFSKKTKRDMVYKESVNSAKLDAKDIVINANRSATIEAGELKAKENIVVNAKEGDLNIVAKEYKEGELHLSKKSSWGGLKKSVDLSSSDALKLNSALLKTEAANVVLTSGEDINILASKIDSGDLLLAKADNINILSSEELSKMEKFHKKSSFSPSFSSKTLTLAKETTTNDTNTISSQKSSSLSGKSVVLEADSEMTLIGSNIVGDSIILNADDINILSATQSNDSKHLSSTKKIGITLTLNSKEASIFAGSQIEKNKIDQGDTTQKASNIVADDIAISSGSHTNILASNIVADSSLAIFAGKNINILSGEALEYKDEVHTSLKAGLSLGVKQHVTQGIKDVANTTKSIANSDNVAGAGFGVLRAVDTISSTLSTPVSAGLNAVAQMKENKSSSINEYAQGSYIYAGDSAMLSASKDLNIKGSDIAVGDKLDIYANNLNVLASKQRASSNSSSSSLDLRVGLYGSNAGEVDLGVATQKQSFNSTTYKNSTILADTLNIEIDNDAKFEGANIDAKEIKATIGNNLTLSSLQNTSNLKGDSKSLSVGSKSGGAGYGKDKNQREWVDKQTTIIGADSVDITVKNNTHLKGAVIASSSNNLNLTTDTLTYENIYDKDKGSSYSAALGFNSSKENQAKMELSLNSRDKEQTTYATLGEGVVQTNSNIADLNRNINNSQLITKDESSSMEIYLSNTSINKALNPNDTLDKWTQDAKDLGLNVRDEILSNLPSAKKEDANTIDNTIGKVLDIAGDYSLGLIPSIDNQGGYITQIATQLFGDNRGIIETATMQELLDMGVDQKDIVQIEDGKYITNPY